MNQPLYRLLQAAAMSALGVFLLERLASGKLLWYINQRFAGLTLTGLIGFFILAAAALIAWARIRRVGANVHSHHPADDPHADHDHGHEHTQGRFSPGGLFWLAVPLAIGVLIPAQPLGAQSAENRGVTLSGAGASGAGQLVQFDLAPEQRTVLDWVRLFNTAEDPSIYQDEPADVIGFVYPDPRLPAGHFLVARFTVSCCVADAFAIGMAVEWPDDLPPDTWVNARGPVQILEVEGQRVPVILAESVTSIEQPAQPYLIP